MTCKYEVQTKFIYGWENVWTSDDKLVNFDTKQEAEAEIKDNVDSWNNDNPKSLIYTQDYRVVLRQK